MGGSLIKVSQTFVEVRWWGATPSNGWGRDQAQQSQSTTTLFGFGGVGIPGLLHSYSMSNQASLMSATRTNSVH